MNTIQMKRSSITIALLLIGFNFFAQQVRLDIAPKSIFLPSNPLEVPSSHVSELLQGRLQCGVIGIVVGPRETNIPFKVYTVKNSNWVLPQDVYNAVTASVPGVQIIQKSLHQIPDFSIRGGDDTIILVDGIRVDAALLNTLNPADMESVKISNNPNAELYLRFR